jgi:uncharacterized protein (DUF1684 family)
MRRVLVAIAMAVLLSACTTPAPDDSAYMSQIAAARSAKDAALREAGSPVPADKRSQFLPLSYFPIDPAYAVPAAFTESPPGPRVEMQTSQNEPRQMERAGVLDFTLRGQRLHLGAFVEVGQSRDRLFVPFTDQTSGTETYHAGRYLDIARSRTGIYVVDFNRAYNPYCYYNPRYDCPLPPRENRLAVPIRAGEKTR